eukprot:5719218-Lingulodinium_polyedra.AAC.1
MGAAGLVPRAVAADLKARRANLQVRPQCCAWMQEHAKAPRRKGEVRVPYVMIVQSCSGKC